MSWQTNIFSKILSLNRDLSRPTGHQNEGTAFSLVPYLSVEWQSLDGVECIVDVLGFATVDFKLLQCAMDESSIAHGLVHVIIVDTIDNLDTLLPPFLIQL